MENFIFDLQRFSQVTIAADDTYKLEGVTYTAVSDAVLNLDDDGKVSGLESGKVQATVTGSDDSPTVTFDATDGAIDFTATSDGKIILAKMVFPLEIISGEFTFNGSTLAISAGSDLAIVNTTDDYSLRNENHFVYDSTYIFSGASMTSDSQQVNSHFALSDGTNTRELDLVQLGKVINNFTERGFTLVKGSSELMNIGDYTITATAIDQDAGLNISLGADGITLVPNTNDGALNVSLTRGDTEIISGDLECTSGSITFGFDHAVTLAKETSFNFTRNGYTLTATTTDKATTAIELTESGLSFTPGTNDGGLNLLLKQDDKILFSGELNVSGGTIHFNPSTQKFSFTEGTNVSIKLAGENPQEFNFKVTGDEASFKVEADGSGTFTITPDSGDGTLDITIKQGDKTIFYNNISVSSGSIIISDMGQTIGLTSGTSMTVTLGNYTIDITANDDANFGLGVLSDGSIAISPKDNDGSLDISISRGTTQIFSNTINISGGTLTFNPATQLMTLTSGTTINLEFGNYELTATAKGNAASSIALTDGGITITPSTGDGTLDLTLTGTSSGSLNANIEVISGSFTLSDGGEITVAAGTELQIKFSDDYIINFKATDKAGGAISLGADGITFAPGSDDGGLQLTVKRGEDTRSASLDVNGSVTYKLDGSISLTKGTVVKNVFDDGNILTITANTDASGSINFNPQTGLTIKPTTTDALTVSLTTSDIEVVNITSIDGSITYQNGIVTATDGTRARITYYFGWKADLYTTGGTASVQFTDDRTIYTANAGATFTVNYLDGTTTEIQHGSYADVYGETIEDYVELVSEGTTLKSNDSEVVFTLEKAGNYTLNGIDITTSKDNVEVQLGGDYDTVQFAADEGIKVSTVEGGKFFIVTPGKDTISFSTQESNNIEVSDGAITFDNTTKKLSCTAGTTLSLTNDNVVSTLTAPEEISASYKVEEGIAYFALDDEATANILVTNDGTPTFAGTLTAGGVVSYNPTTGTYGLTGANSSHGDGKNTFAEITTANGYSIKLETNDTTVVFVPKIADGKLELNFPNENKNAMAFTLGKDGETILERQLIVNGTIGFDVASQEISLTQGTVISLSPDGENWLEFTAKGDASGQLQFTDSGIRFAPNAGDGKLELNFTANNRKATLDVSAGAIILGNDGMMSLEEGTVTNLEWEDGTTLTITASDTGGSFGFDAQGLKVSSNGELSIDLKAGDLQTTMSKLKGTIHYNAGQVLFDADSKLTATSSLGGQPTNITLESNGTGGYIEISASGTNYVAGTGALKVTWARDGKESTFSINSGSAYIGHGIFEIAKGTSLSTDLKDLIPTLNFTTTDAGTYTINGQTITTTAENISMTATDDYMKFVTSSDPVLYNDMTFAGAGNVSLSTAGVVLGAGVVADGFGKDKMFILAEAGNVTADARIFELTEEVPTGISVTGAEDGFIFSRTNTEESEARFDDPAPANVGKIFTEEFFLTNDDSYRIQTDLLGLQQIIGVSSPATIKGTATFDGESERTVFDVVTETEGVFTVADKDYSISGDDSVAIKVGFEPDESYVRGFDSLSGTVSGDFTAHEVSINGSASAVRPVEDTLISIAADENGFEVSGLNDGAILWVGAKDTYIVNGTTINANAGDYIAGSGDNFAYLLAMSNNTVVTGTESDDYIGNHGTNVTINALGGNDTIMNYGASNVTINGDADNDIIFNVARVNAQTGEVTESPDNVLINGGAGNDYIAAEGSNVTITGGAGNDIIEINGDNTSVDAGAGSNQIKVSGKNEVILLKGRTTVEGFNTGFGEGSDTIYIKSENDPAGVEFLEDGLTFGNDTASLTLSDVTTTAKVNLFHENRDVLNKGVFIAAGDWYEVEDSDLTVNAGEEVYFVGTAANPKAGVDFSKVTTDLNVTLDTEYEIPNNTTWINGVYSIKGGAGNTTITGSDKSDTIISGTGKTTINAGDGDDSISNSGAGNILRGNAGNDTISNDGDNLSINGGAGSDSIVNNGSNVTINAGDGDDLITNTGENVLFKYYSTGGNDSIVGFNSTSTLSIADEYSSSVSGNDLIVTVGDSKITLVDAASLSSANIESTDLSPSESLAETILKRTALGYPAMAARAFSPDAKFGDEPTNYAAKEDWNITSTDNLKLHAVHYTPENSNDKWVVLVHGYGNNHKAMYLYATSYLENGYNVLMIDQRTAGESEGTWLTMGGAESKDVALWTQEIARRNSNAKITLHGVSMGSATAMLAASRFDAANVVALVEDCGYTSAMEVFYLLNGAYVGAPTEVIAGMDGVAEEFTGHYISEAAPIDSISSAKMPTLFISGDADTVVPVSMLSELYDASGAEVKEKFIVKDAPHALAGLNDSVGYNNAVFRFVAEASGEGWNTTNITDNISLRGTKYNDTIANYGSNVTIQAQDGNDSISNFGDNVSIDAGKGDDLISLSGGSVLVQYAEGDGNDTITGFDSNATLSIGDNVYSTQLSGDDLIITIGESKLTLVDAANLSDPNIKSTNEVVRLVEAILKRTALGYPLASGILLNPEELVGEEPTNYSAKEDWSITSADNLELYGVHYAPENSNDKWVVLVHGYGLKYESMYPFTSFYLKNGYNVLMIDQRAAGNSEGTWLTMGAAESQDVALWTQEIARRNSNAKITLHGVSMGSATAMLAASRSDAVNVTSLIEDCGYTSAMKLFYVLKDVLNEGLKEFGIEEISSEVVAAMDSVGHGMMGYYLHDAAPIDSISSAKMPTLFISGDDDGVVPVSMLSELYDASGAEVKEKFIVKDAGHAQAGLNDPIGYSNAVFRFIAEANGEGWETTNIDDNISLRGTKYNDTITNYGSNVTISAVEGDDSITNTSEYSIIDGGEGNDTIYNYSPTGILASNGVSINAGADDDTIINEHAYYVTLDGGEGDDKIIVRLGDHTTIEGGAGNDTIIGETVEGESSTWAMGGYSNINGGSGDDYINPIFSDSASILGGEGNDTIINEGDDATINGGEGDDVISLQGASLNNDVIKYEAGDGNDIIYGFNETTKLSITAGAEYSTVESGDDVIVNVGDNAITIAGGAGLSTINIINYEIPALNISNTTNNTLITGTENNDTIRNSGSNVTIKGAAGNDSITSSGMNSSMHGGAGSDAIRNSGASSSIFGAEGDDLLINTADDALVDGGYGNDIITNSGDSVTIKPGGGFDSISNSGDNVVINYTGGNDSIQGFNATSTLSLSSDDYEVVEGSRNIFVFSGESFAVLQGAFLTNDSININDTAYAVEGKVISLESGGDEVAISRSNVSIVGGTGDDIIILTSDAANNTIEYAGGNDTIYGFNETSKLTIAGEHSSIKIGDDVFVTVGNNIITLVDASSVMATDFEDGESILLTAKGAVTVGNRVFELTEKVKNGVTITGTADGFTSGITNKDGSIFVEEFIAKYDDSYTVQIGGDGLHTISGINAGTEVSTSATKDSESVENQFYLVMGDAGSYTLGDLEITATNDGTEILFASDGINFAADAGISYDGKTFSGDGNIELPAFSYQLPAILGASVSATGFEDGESFILAQAGTTTINGRTFELTEDIPDGMTITANDGGYSSSVMTDGAILAEEFSVAGDDNYSVQVSPDGLVKLSGISNNATINANGTYDGQEIEQYFYLDTDTEGAFTIGKKTYTISGDSNVEIEATFNPDKSYASGFASLEGTVSGNFDGDEFYVNGNKNPILIEGDDAFKVIGTSSGTKLFGVSGNATLASLGGVSEVHTDTEGEFWIAAKPVPFGVTVTGDDNVTFGFNDKGDLMTVDDLEGSIEFSKGTGGTLSINGIGIHTRGIDFSSIGAYDNSLYIHDIERGTITAYELEKVWLQMSGETMTLNGNELTLTADSDGIWLRDKEIVGLDAGASLQVSEAGTYTANTTELEAKAGDVIVGLEGDAYIYDADNPLITKDTSEEKIISHFKPNNQTVVGASETTNQNITLNGGDLAIVEATSAPVNITAGDDTVVSQGENVAVNLTGGNTWLFPIGGKMTLEGYDASTGSGFGTTYTDIASAVADGTIDFNDGRLTLGAAKVYVGKSSELMNFFDRAGDLQKVGFASRNDSLDVSNATDDLVLVAKKDSTITGGAGDDTILATGRTFVDAGAGSNLVSVSSDGRVNIAFNGNTTVEGFHTGFGRGSDTVYISEVYPAVDFKEGVLTFYNDTNSLTFKGITKTAQINTYYAENGTTAKEVYIADDEWYDVADGAADYYIGATATKNHGIDFSGITTPVNVTLNTDYNSPTATFWVNNIHSIVGGAGNTSITGSDKADTILAGTGRNNIWSGAGNDLMFGNTDAGKQSSTFFHVTGDGRDTIESFDFMDSASDSKSDVVKLGSAITGVSMNGENVILQTNNNANDSLTLTNAKGKTFNLNDDLIAKVGDSVVAFDGFTNCYAATSSNATLTVGSGMSKVEVWLGDTSLEKHGTMFYGNFKELNAAQSDGMNILAGNELSNVITGGSGRNSLWGGSGSASDTLVGGTGHNDFFYCAGNGNDLIQGMNDGDNVILDGITLDQIARADIYSGSVYIDFNDGGLLRVNGTADVTYQLADGSKYSANHSRREWVTK